MFMPAGEGGNPDPHPRFADAPPASRRGPGVACAGAGRLAYLVFLSGHAAEIIGPFTCACGGRSAPTASWGKPFISRSGNYVTDHWPPVSRSIQWMPWFGSSPLAPAGRQLRACGTRAPGWWSERRRPAGNSLPLRGPTRRGAPPDPTHQARQRRSRAGGGSVGFPVGDRRLIANGSSPQSRPRGEPPNWWTSRHRAAASALDSLPEGSGVFLQSSAASILACRAPARLAALVQTRRVALVDGPVSIPFARFPAEARVDLVTWIGARWPRDW